jgi:hypothetical protein
MRKITGTDNAAKNLTFTRWKARGRESKAGT